MSPAVDARSTASWSSWVSIFTSSGTLLCCALPAALVAVGAGATLASLVGAVPQLVWLSEHKGPLFAIAAGMRPTQHFMLDRATCAACGATNEFPLELRS